MVGIRFRALLIFSAFTGTAAAQPPAPDVAPAARGFETRQAPVPPSHTAAADTVLEGPSPPSEPPAKRWYGWQTLTLDAAAATLIGIGVSIRDGDAPGLLGFSGYVFGGPVVHLVHDRPGAAAGSLGLRLGVPVVAAIAGAGAGEGCEGDFCGYEGLIIGGAIGMGLAAVLDAALLGSEEVRAPKRWYAITSVAPAVDPARGTAGVSMGGTF